MCQFIIYWLEHGHLLVSGFVQESFQNYNENLAP